MRLSVVVAAIPTALFPIALLRMGLMLRSVQRVIPQSVIGKSDWLSRFRAYRQQRERGLRLAAGPSPALMRGKKGRGSLAFNRRCRPSDQSRIFALSGPPMNPADLISPFRWGIRARERAPRAEHLDFLLCRHFRHS
jgi:hypothetical protein